MGTYGASRRDAITGLLGATGVLGASQMLNAKEARADDLENLQVTGGQIAPSLLDALRFDRKNAEDPGAVFLPDRGILAGFGPNLFHCDTSSNTCRLFVKGRQVLVSTVSEDVAANIDVLAVGTSGIAIQTIRDSSGRVITSTLFVEAINDPPDDFLVTGQTQSTRFTGAFFRIIFETRLPDGKVAEIKTTLNVLTRSFPLGVNVISHVPWSSIIDPNTKALLEIAAQTIDQKFGRLLAVIPTGLQTDFPWGAVFHFIGAVASCSFADTGVGAAACGYFVGKFIDDIVELVG
jgi:hypothetical protein